MRIKLDENLSRHLKSLLIEAGHEASTVADENLLGKPDTDIAAAAQSENMMIFTLDVAFADIRRFPPGQHPGTIAFEFAAPESLIKIEETSGSVCRFLLSKGNNAQWCWIRSGRDRANLRDQGRGEISTLCLSSSVTRWHGSVPFEPF